MSDEQAIEDAKQTVKLLTDNGAQLNLKAHGETPLVSLLAESGEMSCRIVAAKGLLCAVRILESQTQTLRALYIMRSSIGSISQ